VISDKLIALIISSLLIASCDSGKDEAGIFSFFHSASTFSVLTIFSCKGSSGNSKILAILLSTVSVLLTYSTESLTTSELSSGF
jgi:hypothetical protein